MGKTPREVEEEKLARRRKVRKKYYWDGLELRPKSSTKPCRGNLIVSLWRKLPWVMREQ
ncbi:MAG: hypothetical protein ACOX0T_01665 [Pelotomaculum sp.]|jgi:hypothetical protein